MSEGDWQERKINRLATAGEEREEKRGSLYFFLLFCSAAAAVGNGKERKRQKAIELGYRRVRASERAKSKMKLILQLIATLHIKESELESLSAHLSPEQRIATLGAVHARRENSSQRKSCDWKLSDFNSTQCE